MKSPGVAASIALVACVVLLALLVRSRQELALGRAQTAALKAANAELETRIASLEGAAVDPAIVTRLEADHREAIKLRGEVGNLKQALAAADKKLSAATPSRVGKPVLETEEPSTNPYARVLQRKIAATLDLGQGVVFGGWPTQPGKQTFALAVPNVSPDDAGLVSVQTKLIEITDEALGKLNTTMLVRAAGQQTTIGAEELAAFIKSVEETPGASVLSSPTVMVSSGRQARVAVTSSRSYPDGNTVEFGPSIDMIPTLGADGKVEMVIDAKLTLPKEELSASTE